MEIDTIQCEDAQTFVSGLPDQSINCIITSPPYFGLRDYEAEGQIGLEDSPEAFVDKLVMLFRESRRALRDDGTLWINISDSYASAWASGRRNGRNLGSRDNRINRMGGDLKEKDLCGIPWSLALALRHDGWYLRRDMIWDKGISGLDAAMDRPRDGHEYIFLFSKIWRPYYFNFEQLPAANRGSVWFVHRSRSKYKGHTAAFPPELIRPMVLSSCPDGGIVFDPFMGSGTTAFVARSLGCHYVGCDISPEYVALANKRLEQAYTPPLFAL